MKKLTITIDLDQYDAGLTGELSIGDFSGIGEAYFSLSQIENFCNSLEKLATDSVGTAGLIGSHEKPDGTEYLELLGLRCYALSSNGVIGIHVTISNPPYTDCRVEEILKMSGEVMANSLEILDFVSQLRGLCTKKNEEAILHGK